MNGYLANLNEIDALITEIDALRVELAAAKKVGDKEDVTLLLQGIAALRTELTECRASLDRAVAK